MIELGEYPSSLCTSKSIWSHQPEVEANQSANKNTQNQNLNVLLKSLLMLHDISTRLFAVHITKTNIDICSCSL